MAEVINLPVPQGADDHAQAETQRRQRLFEWADAILDSLGLRGAVAAARSIEELHGITLAADSADVILAVRDAAHPLGGHRRAASS